MSSLVKASLVLLLSAAAGAGCVQPTEVGEEGQNAKGAGSVPAASCNTTYRNESTSTAAMASYACAPGLSFTGKEWVRSLQVATAGDVVVSTNNANAYSFIAVLRDDGSGTVDPNACVSANYYAVRFTAAANEKFLVVVDSDSTDMTFDVRVECGAAIAEASCADGFDNDGDFKVDCADSDCASQAACATRCQTTTALSCGQTLVQGSTSGFGTTDMVDSYSCPSDRVPNSPEHGYTFVPTASGPVVFTASNYGQYPMLYVMEDDGTGCNPNRCVAFNYYSVKFNAVAGKTYYLMVDGRGDVSYSYMASVICDAPTTESNCSDNVDEDGDGFIDCKDPDCGSSVACTSTSCSVADSISCSTVRLAGTTADMPPAATNMWSYSCSPNLSLGGPERVYRIEPVTKSQKMLVTLSNTSTYGWVGIIEERSNSCGPTNCIAGNYYGALFQAMAGKQYYAVVEGDYAPTINYEVSTVCAPPASENLATNGCTDQIDDDGDALIDCADPDCASACRMANSCTASADITCSTKLLAGSTSGTTNGVSSYGCFPGGTLPGNDRTYRFVATQTGFVNFTTSDRTNYASVSVLEDQGNGCDPSACRTFQYYSNLVYVTAGKTYYVVVDAPQSGGVDYKLSVVCNPPATETNCSDNIDDDGDFLVDAADPDCK